MADNTSQSGPIIERRIDIGAQVGIERNRLFAAGGRTGRTTLMAYNSWRPLLDGGRLAILAPAANQTFRDYVRIISKY